MHILLLIIAVTAVFGGLLCPSGPPSLTLKLPEVAPCRQKILRKGEISTKTANNEPYITKATLVTMDKCTAEATYYFFGAHVCNENCKPYQLSETEAEGVSHGYCPSLETGHHFKFDHVGGERPACIYSWPRTTVTAQMVCRRYLGHIMYTPGGLPHTTLVPNVHCHYMDGKCDMGDGGWLFWDVDERSSHTMIESHREDAMCDGSRIWLPQKNIGFGLVHPGNCEWEGWAPTIEGVEIAWTRIHKRSAISREEVLSLSEWGMTHALGSGTFCSSMMGIVPASQLIPHANPTVYAQKLLNRSDVVAESSGNYLFIWYCIYHPTTPSNKTTCHTLPRVILNNTDGFLDKNEQFVLDSPEVDCRSHILVYSMNDTPYVEIGERAFKLNVTTLTHLSGPLTMSALAPHFSGIYPIHPDLNVLMQDIYAVQEQLVTHARDIGATIGGAGGGLGNVNLPGFLSGWFAGFVAFFQTVGTIGGILFICSGLFNLIGNRRNVPAYIPAQM